MRKLLALGVIALMYSCNDCHECITNMDENGAPSGYERTITVCDEYEEMYCIREK